MPAWLLGVAGVLAIFVAYVRVFRGEFLWDDDAHIYTNPTIVGPLGLKEIWTSGKANYFPLTMTSFWVQHALWGLAPGLYHLVTLAFHIGAALVLWRVLDRLAVPGAWLGAMLWALHPVQVESAAWICELKNTQSAFFYLLAIYFFLRCLPRGDAPPAVSRDYVLALLGAVFAILSKSSTVMLPVVLGLVGWWSGRRRWRDVLWLWPFLAVSLLASGWTIWEQKVNSMASGPDWGHGFAARFTIAGKVPWFYLGKLLWPHPLVFIYPRWEVASLGLLDWLPLAATIGFVIWLWRIRDTRLRPVFLAFAVFGLSLFPVLGLFDVFFFKYSFVGDHFQYLASMGPLALIGVGVSWLARDSRRAQLGLSAALLGLCGLLTLQQTGIYLSREALWRDTVDRNPRAWIARMNLGTEYMMSARSALAIPHFQAALELRPNDALAEANWGGALYQLGQPAEAIPHLENAMRLMPSLAEGANSLGLAYAAMGRTADAVAQFESAIRLKPQFEIAVVNLANALLASGRMPDAIRYYEEALRLRPDNFDVHVNLGTALLRSGRGAEAIPHYLAAAQAQPQSAAARNNLASALLQSGRVPEAIEQYRAALQLDPGYLDARMNLALVFEGTGRKNEAMEQYEEVLRRKPDHIPAREKLQRLRTP